MRPSLNTSQAAPIRGAILSPQPKLMGFDPSAASELAGRYSLSKRKPALTVRPWPIVQASWAKSPWLKLVALPPEPKSKRWRFRTGQHSFRLKTGTLPSRKLLRRWNSAGHKSRSTRRPRRTDVGLVVALQNVVLQAIELVSELEVVGSPPSALKPGHIRVKL